MMETSVSVSLSDSVALSGQSLQLWTQLQAEICFHVPWITSKSFLPPQHDLRRMLYRTVSLTVSGIVGWMKAKDARRQRIQGKNDQLALFSILGGMVSACGFWNVWSREERLMFQQQFEVKWWKKFDEKRCGVTQTRFLSFLFRSLCDLGHPSTQDPNLRFLFPTNFNW